MKLIIETPDKLSMDTIQMSLDILGWTLIGQHVEAKPKTRQTKAITAEPIILRMDGEVVREIDAVDVQAGIKKLMVGLLSAQNSDGRCKAEFTTYACRNAQTTADYVNAWNDAHHYVKG